MLGSTHARSFVLLALAVVAVVAVVAVSRSTPVTVLGEADALALAEADFGLSSKSAATAGAGRSKQRDAEEKAADSAATKLVDEAFARAMAGDVACMKRARALSMRGRVERRFPQGQVSWKRLLLTLLRCAQMPKASPSSRFNLLPWCRCTQQLGSPGYQRPRRRRRPSGSGSELMLCSLTLRSSRLLSARQQFQRWQLCRRPGN